MNMHAHIHTVYVQFNHCTQDLITAVKFLRTETSIVTVLRMKTRLVNESDVMVSHINLVC